MLLTGRWALGTQNALNSLPLHGQLDNTTLVMVRKMVDDGSFYNFTHGSLQIN